ncbi:MAG: hypothetical protein D6757_00795 [Alphaproteobacteria bacterium]|nr:MAG: hypothetical protein D6757_00795 [Alphaproteobacteria bacterium]
MVLAFAYALALPAGAVPCVHHAAAMEATKAQTAEVHDHHAHFATADRASIAHKKAEHLFHKLGCDCCIGGMCGGTCAGGCSLPPVAGAFLTIDTMADGPNASAFRSRAAADTRVDLSAPMIRPQAPRAPPVA